MRAERGYRIGGRHALQGYRVGVSKRSLKFLFGDTRDEVEPRHWPLAWTALALDTKGEYVKPFGIFSDSDRSDAAFWGRLAGTEAPRG